MPVFQRGNRPALGRRRWAQESVSRVQRCDPTHSTVASSTVPSGESTQAPEGHPGKAEPSRAKSRLLPNMPKLVIPSAATKFPPEITVTPPTPTLLSPKGSISEETKQKLKVTEGAGWGTRVGGIGGSVGYRGPGAGPGCPDHCPAWSVQSAILSAQSAANVRKESLCQPALEVLETSSQESSLESDTDEDDDYMDI